MCNRSDYPEGEVDLGWQKISFKTLQVHFHDHGHSHLAQDKYSPVSFGVRGGFCISFCNEPRWMTVNVCSYTVGDQDIFHRRTEMLFRNQVCILNMDINNISKLSRSGFCCPGKWAILTRLVLMEELHATFCFFPNKHRQFVIRLAGSWTSKSLQH